MKTLIPRSFETIGITDIQALAIEALDRDEAKAKKSKNKKAAKLYRFQRRCFSELRAQLIAASDPKPV